LADPGVTVELVGTTLDIRILVADMPVALSYDAGGDTYMVESPGCNGRVSFANAAVTTVAVTGTADAGQEFTLGGSSLPDGTGLFDGLMVDATVDTTRLSGAIRTGSGVTIDSPTITLGAAVETIGTNQSYGGQVALASHVVLTGGRVAFGAGVSGQGHGLVLDFADTTTIDGDAFTGIGDFASGGGGTTVLSGTLATIGSQKFADVVELDPSASLVTLSAGAGAGSGESTRFADVTFLGTVTGAGGLRVMTDGITTFAAPVSLGSFSTDDAGTTRLATPSFTTTGAQNLFETLELGSDTTLVADSIKLTNVVGMGNRLSLAVTQRVALDAEMFAEMRALLVTGPALLAGRFTAIESLSFSSPLTFNRLVADTILSAPAITLAGEFQATDSLLWCEGTTSITGFVSGLNELRISGAGLLSGYLGADTHVYADAVSLAGRTQFKGGTASFGQGLDGFGNHLTLALSSAVTVDNGVFRGVGGFDTASFTTAVLRSFTTSGFQSYGGPVEMSGPVTLAASHVEFRGTVVGPDALTIVTSGADGQWFGTEIHGPVSVGSLEITGTKPTALVFGGAVETIGIQRYANDLVTFASVTTLTGSEVTVTGTVEGRGTILLIPGNAVFGSQVFGLSRLEVGGTTSLAGNVTTDLAQVYGGRVTLAADSVLTGTMGSFPAGLETDGHSLGLMFSEPMTLDPKVFSGVGALSVGGGGTTTLVTDIGTTGGQYYLDELLLQADVSLIAGSEGITFAGPVRSTGQDLRTVTSGDTSFGDEVVVRKLDVALGRTVIGVPAAKASIAIDTQQSQSFAGDVLVIKSAVLTAGGGFLFAGAVTGPSSLELRSDQTTVFGGAVSLGSLHTDAGGSTILETGALTTTDPTSMEFGDAVILTRDTVFDAGTGALTFKSTVDGPFALLAKSSGATTFAGAVGSKQKLASLTTDAGGTTEIRGGKVTTTLPAGQVYGDAVILGTPTTVAAGAGAIAFRQAVSGKVGLRATTTGATTFAGPVTVANLETDAGGTVSLTNATTTGFQKFHDDTVLLAGTYQTGGGAFAIDRATTLAGVTTVKTGAGPISFAGPINGAFALTAASAGLTEFGGVVGSAEPLAALSTDAGGTTRIAAPLVRVAAGGMSFGDPVRIAAKTSLTAVGGPVGFGAALDGRFPVTVAAGGAIAFAGPVGAAAPLAGLTLAGATSVVAKAPLQLVSTAAQANGLVVGAAVSGVVLTAPGSFISGFSGNGIRFLGGSVGSTLDGFTLSGNGTGIRVAGGGYAGTSIQGMRIVANKGSGIVLDATAGAVAGLRIGGPQPFGSGGATPTGNRIAGNARHGIETTAGTFTGTTVVSNSILGNGTGAFGSGLAIAGTGLVVGWDGATGTAARPNQISGNAANGVLLTGTSVVLSNAIHSNGGEPGKGILASGTAAASAPAPVIARSVRDNATGVVRIQVSLAPAAAGHLVQLYANARDDIFGFPVNTAAFEGRAAVASARADGSGLVTFELPSAVVPVGTWLTATATRLDANGATLATSALSRGAMATAAPVIAVGGDGPTTTWDREVAYTVGEKGTLVATGLTAGMVASLTSRQAGKLALADVPVILTPESSAPAGIRTVADIVATGDGVEITLAPGAALVAGTRGTLALAAVSLPAARLVDASLLRDTAPAPVGNAAIVTEVFGGELAAALDRARAAGETSATAAEIHAFVNRFQGGLRVAAADLDADGFTDMVIAPGAVPSQLVDPVTQKADGTGRPLAAVFGAAARTILLVNGNPAATAWKTVALDMTTLLDSTPGYAGGLVVAVGDVLPEGLPAGRAGLPELVVATTGLVDPSTRRGADRAWVFDLAVAATGAVPTVVREAAAADGTRAPRPAQALVLPAAAVTGVTVGAFATDIGQLAAPQGTIVVATTTAAPSQVTTFSGVRAMDTAQVTLFGSAARGLAPIATLPVVGAIESGPAKTLQNAFILGASLASGDVDGDFKTDLVLGAARGGQGAFRIVDNAIVRALLAGAAKTAAAQGALAEALSTAAQKFGIAGHNGARPTDNGGAWQPMAGTDFFLGKSIPTPTGAGFNAPLSIAVVERSGRAFTADVFAALGASNHANEQVRWYEWQASGSWRAGDALGVDDPAAGAAADPDSPDWTGAWFRAGRGLRLG
jgi:hypothetical protein